MIRSKAKNLYHFEANELPLLFKEAKRILRNNALDILIFPKKHTYGRLLVVTPKKIGNAVKRNKIRRQFKAIFYENKLFESNNDILLIIKKNALELPFITLQELFLKALKQ